MPRDLTVRVRADVGAYQKAMSAAASSTNQFAQAGLRLQKMGMGISNLGDTLTRRVTLPLGLAGAAAIKMASDFDAAFVKATTLAGVSADEVDGLKESVLDLAGETGRAPQELAEALYFLSSSGLDSQQAMEALEASAKGAAVGLGSTQQVADAVSSAMLAYADSGLSAAEATDVLIETARQGKTEPAELAAQMGRLLPLSTSLKVSFDQVGGALAVLSQAGGTTEQHVTGLLNVFSKLLKPSQQAEEILAGVGLSLEDVQRSITERGLIDTLYGLRDTLGDDAYRRFLEDTQAITAGLALTNGEASKTKAVFDAVADSAGVTENAFSQWAESMGAQNAQAFAQFQVALIRVGEVLAPIASDVLSFVAKIAEAFSDLPGPVRNVILAFAGFAAAMGPIMSVGGRLITVVGTLKRLLPELALPAGTIEGAFGGAATSTSKFGAALRTLGTASLVAGGLLALHEVIVSLDGDLKGIDVSKLEQDLMKVARSGELTGKVLEIVGEDFQEALGDPNEAEQFAERLGKVDEALAQLAARDPQAAAAAFRAINEALRDQGADTEQIEGFFDQYAAAVANAGTESQIATGGIDAAGGALEGAATDAQAAADALTEYSDQLRAMVDPVFAAMDAITGVRDAQLAEKDAIAAVIFAQQALNEARASGDPAAVAEAERGLADAQRALSDAQWTTVTSAAEADSALAGLSAAVERGDVSVDTFKDTLATWVRQGFLTQDQANRAAAAVGGLAGQADEADKKRVDIPVTTPGAKESRSQLRGTRDDAHSIPKSRQVTLATVGAGSARAELRRVRDEAFNIPSSRTIYINVAGAAAAANALARAGRQHGGPVLAGEAYVVGEAGPELLLMGNQSGYVVPNGDFGHPRGGGGGWGAAGAGGVMNITNITVDKVIANDPVQLVEQLRRYNRSNGPLPVKVRG